ncbi:MAG: RNA-binding transcriptional accessory protein [Deltaproteobacteria bacterium]|nr:RNA-binding transcriptional accessory protein [Deltaproteobacteria bacterium]
MNEPLLKSVATELGLGAGQVRATVELLASGATIPFVARYRKEVTGSLDEVQIAAVSDRYEYRRELEERKGVVLQSVEGQGRLTEELRAQIAACATKQELEDLYLPYKPKRRTKGDAAREKGLEPLALRALAQEDREGDLVAIAGAFVNPEAGVSTPEEALSEAAYIVAEIVAHDAGARGEVRELTWDKGRLKSAVVPEKAAGRTKFEIYYDYAEPLKTAPSHRVLALWRGEEEEVLRVSVVAPEEEILGRLAARFVRDPASVWHGYLLRAIEDAYRRLLAPSIAVDLRVELKEKADEAAIEVFAQNLRHLLLASPAGHRRVVAVDPGFRTGCKVVALSELGDLAEWTTIYPHLGEAQQEKARRTLAELVERHRAEFVVVGNGTAGRETEALVSGVLREHPEWRCGCLLVSEAGASVYSASEVAREEFPDLDVSVRGAASIGRRFQDPLAELVKIDPKSIGVGQYQHDVSQPRLRKALDRIVESCVNSVGVDVNTASPSLLRYVSGIGEGLARNVAAHRREKGAFRSRQELRAVSRLGPKAFEQAAGFLRIAGGENPLDASAVHPERYGLVEAMARDLGVEVSALVGSDTLVGRIDAKRYVGREVGLPTVLDILAELRKPGRDPRDAFDPPVFDDAVRELKDLEEGMWLNGVVTNVTHFGAFVDVGVHQDGLVHVSELADRFVKDPAEVVAVGQKVRVRVVSVDSERGRIGLSLKQKAEGGTASAGSGSVAADNRSRRQPASQAPVRQVPEAAPAEPWKAALAAKFKGKG